MATADYDVNPENKWILKVYPDGTLKTVFGRAKINGSRYKITSRKEGYHGEYLHRLIFEDFYKINIEDEFEGNMHVHHIDGNPQNNNIWNLCLLTAGEHATLHHIGMFHTEESKRKMSESKLGEKHHMYGKKYSKEHNRRLSESLRGRKLSKEHRLKISERTRGENNPRYKDYPRIKKGGYQNGKPRYSIVYKCKVIKTSVHKDKLLEYLENFKKKINQGHVIE